MIIVVCGPTGVGKTKLSVELAKKYNGIVINADATQIYKELNIGSAKVTEEEKENIPHYLFDIRKPNELYSVSDYQKDLREQLEKHKDKNIILVGGTGLYIKAGLYDYKFNEYKDIDLSKYRDEELYKMCKEKDKNCNIHINNRVRLENFLKREDNENNGNTLIYDNVYFVGLTTSRSNLYERINKRVDKMIEMGLIDEVKNLYNKYPNSMILKRAIGYKEIISYLKGEISFSESIELVKQNSRHYAKKQYTWFNNQMDIKWFDVNFNNFDNTINEVINYINK